MSSETLLYIIIFIISLDFVIDQVLDYLNARHFDDPIPAPLKDVYDEEKYERSQQYKLTRYRFGILSSCFSFLLLLLFIMYDGFAFVDQVAREISDHRIVRGLLFFGFIFIASDLLSVPFSWYSTFVIEEKFGFNKTNMKTFVLDKLKGILLMLVIGGGILSLIMWFFFLDPENFWWYSWILIAVFSIFMNMFYARLIVPLFNKQHPLPEGSLRDKIEAYADREGFSLEKIMVIDGSKRSTKANAYFSGFGREKRVSLYDTLISDLEEEEIVAVLAHEVGHYKHRHILINLTLGILSTGLMLWLLSYLAQSELLSSALGLAEPAFHVNLLAFGILYGPLSELLGIATNILSRKFEYQADRFAAKTYNAKALISSLKKLSRNSLSNLTPHPLYVFYHYSHPTLYQRYNKLSSE